MIKKMFLSRKCFSHSILLIASTALFLAGCVTGKHLYKKAEDLRVERKYSEAMEYYIQAIKRNPQEARFKLRLLEITMEASNYFYRLALKHKEEKNYQLALVELNKTLEYNPSNPIAQAEKKSVLKIINEEENNKEDKTRIQQLKEKAAMENIEFWKNEAKVNMKMSEKSDLKEILKGISKIGGINILFDSSFKTGSCEISLENVTISESLRRICLLKGLFYKVLDDKTLVIIPDTSAKRKEYEDQILKTFFLSNIKAEDSLKLITAITKITNLVANPYQNSVTVRETPEKVALVEKLINLYDKRKAEVMMKVEIMEVNRDRLKEYGAYLSDYMVTQGISTPTTTGTGTTAVAATTGAIKGNRFFYLDSSDFVFSIPNVLYSLLGSENDSKVIAQPQVRGEDGQKISIKLGDKVPVPRTSWVPYATGGPTGQPITSYDLLDIGIEVNIEPRVHHNSEISMDLEFLLTFITSEGNDRIPPTLGNRSVKTKIRLKDGETGIMAGLLRDSERNAVKGFPGLVKIPFLKDIFSYNKKQSSQTDIILSITPYIIRMPEIEEEDLQAIPSGTESMIYLNNEKKEEEKMQKKEEKKEEKKENIK